MKKKRLERYLEQTVEAWTDADAASRNLTEWILWNTELSIQEIAEIARRPRP